MSNIGFYTVNTEKKYVKLSDITGTEFTEGTKYLLQVQSAEPFYFCVSVEPPEKGGFKVGLDPFTYTPNAGSDVYVCTYGKAYLNIAI